MDVLRLWLQGKKTYLSAIVTISTALLAYANGTMTLTQLLIAAGGTSIAVSLRAAISRIGGVK